ncbi:MAG: hypothetical protein HY056_05020 [Proteobacteria bacterium]|nr:hypothetical protein [Pseudomonadota bacterium]
MELEKQVCSLELAKRLKEVCVKQESAFSWTRELNATEFTVCSQHRNEYVSDRVSAFTVVELGEYLMKCRDAMRNGPGFRLFLDLNRFVVCGCDGEIDYSGEVEADARAKMLVYLLENKLIPMNGGISERSIGT